MKQPRVFVFFWFFLSPKNVKSSSYPHSDNMLRHMLDDGLHPNVTRHHQHVIYPLVIICFLHPERSKVACIKRANAWLCRHLYHFSRLYRSQKLDCDDCCTVLNALQKPKARFSWLLHGFQGPTEGTLVVLRLRRRRQTLQSVQLFNETTPNMPTNPTVQLFNETTSSFVVFFSLLWPSGLPRIAKTSRFLVRILVIFPQTWPVALKTLSYNVRIPFFLWSMTGYIEM